MKIKRFTISIPEPCSENWNYMTLTERGKFCAHCQKEVVDFSIKTDSEIANFIKQNKGNLCGRFIKSQLGKEYSYIEQEKYSNLKYAAALALSLLTTENIVAQDNKPKIEIKQPVSGEDTLRKVSPKIDTLEANNIDLTKLQDFAAGGLQIISEPKIIDSSFLKTIQKIEITKSKKKKR